jgi:hypothetical protein
MPRKLPAFADSHISINGHDSDNCHSFKSLPFFDRRGI